MEQIDAPLLNRLMALAIGPQDAALSFEARLAREQGWRPAHARRVMNEYRRFLYLAATAPAFSPVTPSEAVDQAWHLHLAYSRDYWEGLCRNVIGRPLHHGPTAGGATEGQRFRAQYDATLARYTALFGPPPPDIWPEADIRFGGRMRWVNGRDHIVVPRRPIRVGGTVLGAALLATCASAGPGVESAFLIAAGAVVIIAVVVGLVSAAKRGAQARRKKEKGDGGCGGACGTSGGRDHPGSHDGAHGDGGGSGCGGCGGGD